MRLPVPTSIFVKMAGVFSLAKLATKGTSRIPHAQGKKYQIISPSPVNSNAESKSSTAAIAKFTLRPKQKPSHK